MMEYFKMMIAAVICISLVCGILPKEGAGKYAGFAAGLIIVFIIISPVFKLTSQHDDLHLSELETEELNVEGGSYIMDAFENTLALRIQEKLESETDIRFDVAVTGKADAEGNVIGVELVEIEPFSAQYAQITADYVGIGIDEVVEHP